MHELALAQEIVAMVGRHVPAAQAGRVRSVHVRIGELAGVVPDSLEFCFSAVVAGTVWESAELVMTRVAAEACCLDCDATFPTAAPGAGCPVCGSRVVRMTHGQELHVDAVELADDELPAPADAEALEALV
ncbi:MAG: hydrogenase maturation nickel metallochaperone HypA [Acidobacteria bacterium]|nr:hydrogenase maturation nickel metallochaperone HypA [Acidobacteriota bacterium]